MMGGPQLSASDAAMYVRDFGPFLVDFKRMRAPERARFLDLVQRFSVDLAAIHDRIRSEEGAA